MTGCYGGCAELHATTTSGMNTSRVNNESSAGFKKEHGETIELERACDEER